MLTFVHAPPEPGVRLRSGKIERVECRAPSLHDDAIIFWLVAQTFRTVTLFENLVFLGEQCFYALLRLLDRTIVSG